MHVERLRVHATKKDIHIVIVVQVDIVLQVVVWYHRQVHPKYVVAVQPQEHVIKIITHIAIVVLVDHMHQVRLVHTEHREQYLRHVVVVRHQVHAILAHQTRVLE